MQRFNSKLDQLCQLFLDMTYKSEFAQKILWDKITLSIAQNKIDCVEEYTDQIKRNIFLPGADTYDQQLMIQELFRSRVLLS